MFTVSMIGQNGVINGIVKGVRTDARTAQIFIDNVLESKQTKIRKPVW